MNIILFCLFNQGVEQGTNMASGLFLKFFGGYAGLFFKEPAKVWAIGKSKTIGNLLEGIFTMYNLSLCFQDNPVMNELHNCFVQLGF